MTVHSEPKWKQSEFQMIECIKKMIPDKEDPYSATNWALWRIVRLEQRVQDLGAYADELESKLDLVRRIK